jgi:hypothetical protein
LKRFERKQRICVYEFKNRLCFKNNKFKEENSMKICPNCNKEYADDVVYFCLDDGAVLVAPDKKIEAETVILPDADIPPTQFFEEERPTNLAFDSDERLSPSPVPRSEKRNLTLWAGIIVAASGLLVAVLGALKVLPGMIGTGIWIILGGVLIFGLSFIPKPGADAAPRMTTADTLLKIFYAPTEVFQNLRRHPRWLVAVLVMSLFSTIYTNAFINRLTAERVVNFTIDKTKEMSFLNDEARANIEKGRADSIEENKNPVRRAGQAVGSFIGLVFWIALLSAIFFLFALAMGGKLNFWQAFAATAYAMLPIYVLRYGLSLIILYLKDPTEIHPIIGANSLVQDSLNFLVTSADNPVLFSLLSAFSLLGFYWLWLNATGLKNAGERVTPTAAWTSVLSIWLLGVVLGVVAALLFPGFLS